MVREIIKITEKFLILKYFELRDNIIINLKSNKIF